jgi:hypothetical protein
MSQTADSVFQSVLPFSATGIDLIERLQWPSGRLYPTDDLVLSPLEAEDYRSRLNLRFGALPHTSNGGYLESSLENYP